MKYWDNINYVSLALWPISILFRLVVVIRRVLFKTGLLKSWRAPVPVIIVGNISVGGTGKTPVVIALVEWLKSQGHRPGVISRGYGGIKLLQPVLLQADSLAKELGDEPVVIFRRTGVPVCVFPKRVEAVRHLLQNSSCTVVIADDGLQHYALQRDFEIVVIDAQKQHGNGFCLPAGPLREPVSRIGKEAFTLYNHVQDCSDGKSFTLKPGNLVALDDARETSAKTFSGKEIIAYAGTASPQRFCQTLSELGMRVKTRIFPDHHRFTIDDFANSENLPIIMTEKDAVKCLNFGLTNAWYLPVETDLPDTLKKRVVQLLTASGVDK